MNFIIALQSRYSFHITISEMGMQQLQDGILWSIRLITKKLDFKFCCNKALRRVHKMPFDTIIIIVLKG